jgi:phosphoribosylaminoimidazolecarboxamide formyltransferase/IMP cyclohydrolase
MTTALPTLLRVTPIFKGDDVGDGIDDATIEFGQGRRVRYGENWHQAAIILADAGAGEHCLANAKQLSGKDMSFNNYLDANVAVGFARPGVVLIKHQSPCGCATGSTSGEAYDMAWKADEEPAFGSVSAGTHEFDLDAAKKMRGRFSEVLVVPSITGEAVDYLRKHKPDLRVLDLGGDFGKPPELDFRVIEGAILVQERDNILYLPDAGIDVCYGDPKKIGERTVGVVTQARPDPRLKGLADFAWLVEKYVKSNGIAICRQYMDGFYQTVGICGGLGSRKRSVKLAAEVAHTTLEMEYMRANIPKEERMIEGREMTPEEFREYLEFDTSTKHAISIAEFNAETTRFYGELAPKFMLSSDSFFPFGDNIKIAARNGIRYIIQPGGSTNDGDVIYACDQNGIAMIFTGIRHFRH